MNTRTQFVRPADVIKYEDFGLRVNIFSQYSE